jgi:putative signal transducing protein
MGGPAYGFVRLLAAPDAVEAELARELLQSAGIPSMLHGQDRDFAELGQAIHMRISRPDVYVPAAELERARSVLADAWDESALTDELALATPLVETAASSARARPTWFFRGLFVAAIVIAIVVGYRKLVA